MKELLLTLSFYRARERDSEDGGDGGDGGIR